LIKQLQYIKKSVKDSQPFSVTPVIADLYKEKGSEEPRTSIILKVKLSEETKE